MLNLPPIVIDLIDPFASCFYGVTTWMKAQIRLIGAILTPGKWVVTEALRVMGLSESEQFAQYHQVLNRAVWSPLELAQVLLKLLVKTFTESGDVLVFGIDPTIERRWGRKIAARGIYRDPVRSSDSHFVKASGLRWISLMLLTPIPWAQRMACEQARALPVMTVLSPSERYYQVRGRNPQTMLARSVQMLKVLRRWLPERALVVVGDSAYAALDFLSEMQRLRLTFVTRLRLDAALYDPAPPYGGKGRPRKKGRRLPTLVQVLNDPDTLWTTTWLPWYDGQVRPMQIASACAVWFHVGKQALPIRWVLVRDPRGDYAPVALLSTDPTAEALSIVCWFVQRWQLEVTFEEIRRHLGVETQRQWSDKAIARTTPLLLGLFSWITLVAHGLYALQPPACHDRREIRHCWVVSQPEYREYLRHEGRWTRLNSLVKLLTIRVTPQKTEVSERYFISSWRASAHDFLHHIRDHWQIENGLHWVLDIAFREDESRIRKDHAPQNMVTLRHMAINLLKQETSVKVGIAAKRKMAGWDNDYLLKVLCA